MRPALAYRRGRDPLHAAGAPAAVAFLASFAILAFSYPSPIVVASVGVTACLVGVAAGARRAVVVTLRWGVSVALLMMAVNALVTDRGFTVLARLGSAPVLGPINVTLESLVYGGTTGLRVLVTLLLFAVYSACVDPDEVLRMLRPLARRSALTASLVVRLVPVAVADLVRLREAAGLRGPGAAPIGRGAMARRTVAGSLDRAVDVAATLELRGYSLPPPAKRERPKLRRSRYDRRFYALALLVAVGGVAALLAGVGSFDAYPQIEIDTGALALALAAALPLLGLVPFWRRRA